MNVESVRQVFKTEYTRCPEDVCSPNFKCVWWCATAAPQFTSRFLLECHNITTANPPAWSWGWLAKKNEEVRGCGHLYTYICFFTGQEAVDDTKISFSQKKQKFSSPRIQEGWRTAPERWANSACPVSSASMCHFLGLLVARYPLMSPGVNWDGGWLQRWCRCWCWCSCRRRRRRRRRRCCRRRCCRPCRYRCRCSCPCRGVMSGEPPPPVEQGLGEWLMTGSATNLLGV